jgi:hypothetical protein
MGLGAVNTVRRASAGGMMNVITEPNRRASMSNVFGTIEDDAEDRS